MEYWQKLFRKCLSLQIIKIFPLFIILLAVIAFSMLNIDKAGAQSSKEEAISSEYLMVAVSAMISPKSTFVYYKNLLDYIGRKLNRKVKIIQRKTYSEVNELIKTRKVDLAFVCSGPYVTGKKDFGMELLVAPEAYGEKVYYSYIIVHKNNRISSFEKLAGKSFAFTDPHSNTGCLVPTYQLARMGKTPDNYFKKFIFTKSHDNSIKAVAKKLVDAASVDHLIWEYADAINPEFTSKTRIIAKFGPFGIPPVVVHPDLDPALKEKMRKLFLQIHEDEKGKSIIDAIHIDKFVNANDEDYDSVRKMEEWLKTRKENH
jgi:phosphonate transport system substrate-binding protein